MSLLSELQKATADALRAYEESEPFQALVKSTIAALRKAASEGKQSLFMAAPESPADVHLLNFLRSQGLLACVSDSDPDQLFIMWKPKARKPPKEFV